MKKVLLSISLVVIGVYLNAMPPGGLGPGGGQDPDNDVPIDGGISLLIAAGAAIGGRKLWQSRKEAK